MVRHCSLCGAETTTGPGKEFPEYSWCLGCGCVRTAYPYDSSIYSEEYAKNYCQNYLNTPINTRLNLSRLGLVARWTDPGKKILDMGCGVGEFIRFAECWYSCTGFEPNRSAWEIAKKRTHSWIFYDLESISDKFDAITMFDVIEHLDEPVKTLEHLIGRCMANPHTILIISTPTIDSIRGVDDLVNWKHWKPKEHLFLYSRKSLEKLLGKVGMEVVYWGTEESDIRPGNPNGDILTCVSWHL